MEEIIDPIAIRREEVAQYDRNISLYQTIIATLPSEWPEHLAHFKGRTDHQAAAAEVENADDVELLAQLLYRQQCEKSVRAERLERTKAAAILAALEAQA